MVLIQRRSSLGRLLIFFKVTSTSITLMFHLINCVIDSKFCILGPLRVLGNVYSGNINVTGLLNGISVDVYQNRYKRVSEGRHLLQGKFLLIIY